MIDLRNYQDKVFKLIMQEIKKALDNVIRLAVFLPTGGGKSVVIGKLAEQLKGRTLILTNREEILKQNYEWLGEDCGLLTAKIDDVMPYHTVVIAMVETLNSRIKKYGDDYFDDFDNVILDEAHINVFQKVYSKFNFKVLIGLTATPAFNKKKYKVIDGIKWQRPLVFGDYYDKIIQGTSTQELIDLGWLVQEFNVVLQDGITERLSDSNSNPDGYTIDSLNAEYTNSASIETLKEAYLKYGVGKKTIIFNPSTKVSDFVYKALKPLANNIKKFDTRSKGEKRSDVVEWFNSTPDAVLVNVNVFTTGFDSPDVQCIILNRATKSLSLYHQMVGRGSRLSKNILKDFFTVIDLGDNVFNHGAWSNDIDWSDYFHKSEYKLSKSMSIISTWDCVECGDINPMTQFTCQCGMTIEENSEIRNSNKKSLKTRSGKLVAISSYPIPTGKKILAYTKQRGEGANFAFKLSEEKIIDLFKHYKVSDNFYKNNKDRFQKRVFDIYRPIYFEIIKSDLSGANRKLESMQNKLIKRIENEL